MKPDLKVQLPVIKRDELISSYKVDKKLHAKVKAKLKKEGQSIHALIEAAFKSYINEK